MDLNLKFLSVREVAEKLSISDQTVKKLIFTKQLKANQIGGQYRITEDSLKSYLEKTEV